MQSVCLLFRKPLLHKIVLICDYLQPEINTAMIYCKNIITSIHYIQKKCHFDKHSLQTAKHLEKQKFSPESNVKYLSLFCSAIVLISFVYILQYWNAYLPFSLISIHKRKTFMQFNNCRKLYFKQLVCSWEQTWCLLSMAVLQSL